MRTAHTYALVVALTMLCGVLFYGTLDQGTNSSQKPPVMLMTAGTTENLSSKEERLGSSHQVFWNFLPEEKNTETSRDTAAKVLIKPAGDATPFGSDRPGTITAIKPLIPTDTMTEQAIPQAPETALANSPVRMPASEPVKMATPKEETRSYHILALVTAYCPCSRCCGKFANGRTSTRTSAWNPGAASDPTVIPYGSMVEVPGYGRVKVDDTGVAMRNSWRKKGRIHLDVRFDYHYQARNWGSKLLTIKVTPPAKKK